MDPFEATLDQLAAERKRLDDLLDDALEQFAHFEEVMNPRMKAASPDELPALMAERGLMEDALGIVELVEQIDVIRERMAVLKG
ncbi:MAG: hypothetical protein H7Z12_15535 [Rhodospirillaceae bacterium]|nr:hypothetical protein [Rhodospirillales bacterium]